MRTLKRMGSLWMRLFPALWMRWAISIIVSVAVIAALVVFVESNNSNSDAKGSAASLEHENQEAQIIVGADQVPHTVTLKGGQSVQAGFVAAVHADIRHRLKTGNIQGRVQKIGCHRSGARRGRVAYSCIAQVQNVKYPFVGVFTTKSKRITYCKRDMPPLPSENIPVSHHCRL
jgi:hypothetical protein